VIERFTRFGLIDRRRREGGRRRRLDRVEVDRRALWTAVLAFSGGNQQKIAIAKWFAGRKPLPPALRSDRGIDVGTKNEALPPDPRLLRAGGAVLFYSTESLRSCISPIAPWSFTPAALPPRSPAPSSRRGDPRGRASVSLEPGRAAA